MWHKFYSNAQFQLSKDFGTKCIHGMLFWHHILFFIPDIKYLKQNKNLGLHCLNVLNSLFFLNNYFINQII
jgi:hypothetical protein